jgi:hypothetical protein
MGRDVVINLRRHTTPKGSASPTPTRQVTLHSILTATVSVTVYCLLPLPADSWLTTPNASSWLIYCLLNAVRLTSCSSTNSGRLLIALPSYHLFLLKNNTEDKLPSASVTGRPAKEGLPSLVGQLLGKNYAKFIRWILAEPSADTRWVTQHVSSKVIPRIWQRKITILIGTSKNLASCRKTMKHATGNVLSAAQMKSTLQARSNKKR